MANLSEFAPIETLDLPGIGTLDCSGLTLIVGPNSSGKSQLLRDIHQKVSGEPRNLVVAAAVRVRRLPYEPLMTALVDAGYIYRFEDDAGSAQIRSKTTYVGTGQTPQQIQLNQLQSWHQTHSASPANPRPRRDEYLAYIGRYLVTALFLDQRLTALNQVGMIDFVNSPPQHDLHALYMNDLAREQLFSEVRASFSKAVWPDISRGTGVCLRVSDQGDIPTALDRLSPTKMNAYRTIETEGDGLKSYVATCVALLLGRRPLCLVDEPEMCLHPPQAYNLGRFIGSFGSSSETATLVATHSSHVLRGVMQTAPRVQIVRLTRLGGHFLAHRVSPEALAEALVRPTVRAEAVLDGVFAQAVAVLEADGDRTVYQAVWETLGREVRLDIHFTTVGGTGGIADTCALYAALRIPVAVIADLDVLTDSDRLRRILKAIGATEASELVHEAQQVAQLIKSLPPTISEVEVKSELQSASSRDFNWAKDDDATLRTQLQTITRRLDRMRRLKGSPEEPLPAAIEKALERIVVRLRGEGLFLVPVGELEQWVAAYDIKASKQNKWAWANEAAALVRKLGYQTGDIWDFTSQVGDYLQNRFEQFARR